MSGDESTSEELRACREASRRRLRDRVEGIVRAIRAPLADVLQEHALVHLPPAAVARLRLVHPAWARRLSSPLFAVAHAAAPRRISGVFVPSAGFLPFDGSDTVPSPTLSFAPASSEITVLSSSHGIACCFSPDDDACFVCNPATASWAGVPSPPCRTWPRPAIVVLFDPTAYNFRGDYALVCAAECEPGSGAYYFQVFTSGTGTWRVTDAIASAEGLVAASGVAAGGTAWWRTSIGTAVGYSPATDRVELVLCPGDSANWEIGSAGGKLHCAVRADSHDVAVFRLDEHRSWEEAARVSVSEMLPPWQLQPAHGHVEAEADDEAASGKELVARSSVVVESKVLWLGGDMRLLGFQGVELEVVLLAGRRLVAFDTGTRRRREVTVPAQEEEGKRWDGAEYAAHTNTLALVAPALLAREPVFEESPDDREVACS